MKRFAGAWKRPRARITGVVYLLYFLTAMLAQLVGGRGLVVLADALNLGAIACYGAVTLFLYDMFAAVNRGVSLVAAFFSLTGCVVMALGLFPAVPSTISPTLFFAFYCMLIGYLIVRSTFLPRILGALMMLAGLGWLISLSPLASYLTTYIDVLGFLAEASLMLWLLVAGVNVPRWNAQAATSGTPGRR
jgi:hypothetical protein